MAEQDPFLSVRHFVAVAQAGSFTAAALALGLTGSALSKSIVRLEARLGVKLLHRTTRRVSLTLEGEAYLASCLQAIQVLEETEQSFASGKQSPSARAHRSARCVWPQACAADPAGIGGQASTAGSVGELQRAQG